LKTRITELLGTELPLIQGGLWGIAYAELCGPVSAAGALGQLTAGMHETPDDLAREIEAVHAVTDKPFGVNFPIHRRDMTGHFEAAIDGGCTAITLTGGDPRPYLEIIAGRVPSLVLVSSVRQALNAERAGAAAVIVVGQEGGGFVGRDDTGTISLTPAVVDAVSIPVVASGGLADARGILAALALGAEGVEMGTRFVAVQESRAADGHKSTIVAADDRGTVVIEPDGRLRIRVVRSEPDGGPTEWGAGQSSALVRELPTVADLIAELRHGVIDGYRRLGDILDG
jgi:NAD(P)H-dependent flavin oxidoreductase YrpB (nitropropane dioxygenase family)